MPHRHAVSVAEHVSLTGVSVRDGLDTPISEATGFEIANAKNADPDIGWQPDSTDPNDTRTLEMLSAVKPVAAVALALKGMGGPDDPDAAVRVRWDGGIGGGLVEKPAAPLVSGTTTDQGITETASWSFVWLARMDPLNLNTGFPRLTEVRTTGPISNTTILVQSRLGTSGQLRINFPRMSGSANNVDTTAQLDDCLPHWVEVHCTDNGSGADLVIMFDGAQVGILSTAVTFASQPGTGVRIASSATHYLGGMWFFNDVLSPAQATLYRYSLRAGSELALEAALNLEETGGTTGADATGNENTMTFGANSGWTTITNPRPGHNPEAVARHQAWRERNAYAAFENGATTPAELDASPVVSAWFWYRSRGGLPAFAPNFCFFGTASTAGNFDWALQERTNGALRLTVDRYSGGSVTTDTGDVNDGSLHGITIRIAWGTASVGVAGVGVSSVGSVPAFVASAIAKFVLSSSNNHSGEIGGPIGIASRPYTHAEMYDFLTGRAHVIPTPATSPTQILMWPLNEGAGTTGKNYGRDAVGADPGGDLTVTAADWIPGGMVNPFAGPYRDPSKRLNLIWLEIADGISPDCGQLLVELFTTSGEAPVVFAIMLFETEWAQNQDFDSGTITSHGPAIERGAGGGTLPGSEVPGRSVSFTLPKVDLDQGGELVMSVARAPQTIRGGTERDAVPVLLVDRVPKRQNWPESCAVVMANQPRVIILSPQHGARLRWGIEFGGPEIFVDP